jgi:NACHT domain
MPAEILLVADVAGSGKSALAHSIGYLCHEKGILKTSFFFQRDIAELSTPVKFISTFARDLSSNGPFAQRLYDVIDKERGLASKFSYRQFEELVLKPSSLLPSDKPLVIIIDALDECAEHSDILLKILRDGVPKLPGMFRFFITFRPTPELNQHLSGRLHILRRSLDVNEQSNLTDIDLYVSHCLSEIFKAKGKQPDAALVEAFTVATEGLFIWASTIILYLRGAFDPESALRRILDENHPKRLPTESKMDQLYTNIMERYDWSDPDFVQAYLAVMGMVLTAREPLRISALSSLNPAISLDIFTNVLGQLRAVLHYLPTEPIRILHKSFRDFMVTCSPDLPYHLNVADHEQQMAIFCLDILNQELKRPIPGTGYLDDSTVLPKGIPPIPDDSISGELWYSCQFGINHCVSILAPSPAVSAALQELIGVNFVRWIEICASKGSFTGVDPGFLTWLKVSILFWTTFSDLILPSLLCQIHRRWYIQFLTWWCCHVCQGD